MTNSKHTPAPWVLVQDHYPEGLAVISEDGRGWRAKSVEIKSGKLRVAEVAWMSHHSHYASQSIEEMNANATLIAAAPDLLEACKNICELSRTSDNLHIIESALAAIAKAEGATVSPQPRSQDQLGE